MIVYRHVDPRFPFLWEAGDQPAARWHRLGEGPVQYFADTPDGAWAEFLRHEELVEPADLEGVERSIWAIELPDEDYPQPRLSPKSLLGDISSYASCQGEAGRLRVSGAKGLRAPSAALLSGGATGWVVDGHLREGPIRDGWTYALFGKQPMLVGWCVCAAGRPRDDVLSRVRYLPSRP